MRDTPWYVTVDRISDDEKWALSVLHAGGQKAMDIIDERIRRVTAIIQMSWNDHEREKRYSGNTYSKVRIPFFEISKDRSLKWEQLEEQ